MKGIPRTCVCGARLEPGEKCARCSSSTYTSGRCLRCGSAVTAGLLCDRCLGRRDEKRRPGYRKAYSDPEYRRNRLERYRLVGGRCESCGTPLKGELFPDGAPWEADHVGEEIAKGGTSGVHELRVRCEPCHNRKTQATRRAARRRR